MPHMLMSFLLQIVRYSAPLFAKASSQRVRGAGPTIAGLAAVPALVSKGGILLAMTYAE